MEPEETAIDVLRRHLYAALAGFNTRERALADAIVRAFHNAADEASYGAEAPEPVPNDNAAPSVPGSAT